MRDATRSCSFCRMGALAGPSAISTNGQVTVPKSILDHLGLRKGSQVMFRVSDDDPKVLMIVPYALFESRYSRGERAEGLDRLTSPGAGAPSESRGNQAR